MTEQPSGKLYTDVLKQPFRSVGSVGVFITTVIFEP